MLISCLVGTARAILLSTAVFCSASAANAAEDEILSPSSLVLQKPPPKAARLWWNCAALRIGSPTSASAVFPSSGKESFLAHQPSYIENAAVSDDDHYIVLKYHVSSGGWAEAFVRTKNGQYRKFLENDYALKQVRAGRVSGLSQRDLPEEPGRNLHCGLALAQSPNRLIFNFGWRFALTYSLEQRRITEWQRSLLRFSTFRKDTDTRFFLSLEELSGQRGLALVASEISKDGGDRYDRLVTFPMTKETPKLSEASSGFN